MIGSDMTAIWKYMLTEPLNIVSMPRGSKVLSVHNQTGTVCIWAEVDMEAGKVRREFEIVGTGETIYPAAEFTREFIGTVICDPFVWHVFERTNTRAEDQQGHSTNGSNKQRGTSRTSSRLL